MESPKEIDEKTIEKFRGGDARAFDELVTRYDGMIYGFLSRMCGNTEKAKDMVQETFLTAYRYLEGFRGDASFKTWLYKIASTSCLRSKRRKINEPSYHLSLDDLLPGEAEKKDGITQSWYNTPAQELLNNELKEQIKKSLLKLPEKYRLVFVLREMEEFNAEETATTLDISVAAVKSRLHRARLFLRKELAEYYLKEQPGSKK